MEGSVKIIFQEGASKASGNNKTAINTKTGETKKTPSSELQEDAKNALSAYAVAKFARQSGNLAKDWVFYEVDKYLDLTNNVQGKVNMNIARNLINKSASTIFNIAYASRYGAVGIGIAAAISIGSFAIDTYQGYNKQFIDIQKKNLQLEFTRQRSGYALTSGDKGENR